MLINDEIDTKTANAIVATRKVILSDIRADEQRKKLDELGQLINTDKTHLQGG